MFSFKCKGKELSLYFAFVIIWIILFCKNVWVVKCYVSRPNEPYLIDVYSYYHIIRYLPSIPGMRNNRSSFTEISSTVLPSPACDASLSIGSPDNISSPTTLNKCLIPNSGMVSLTAMLTESWVNRRVQYFTSLLYFTKFITNWEPYSTNISTVTEMTHIFNTLKNQQFISVTSPFSFSRSRCTQNPTTPNWYKLNLIWSSN